MQPWQVDFMRTALITGVIVGIMAPAIGLFLVERRMSLVGDGIGHTAFFGVAVGIAIGVDPVVCALVAAIGGAVLIEWLRSSRRAAGDQALALLFYSGLAAGIVVISAAGSMDASIFSYLFGSILTVSDADLLLVALLAMINLSIVAVCWRLFTGVAIDEEGAQVSGVPVRAVNLVIAILAGATIAASMRSVGVLLIAALMVLPVMSASRVARSLLGTMLIAMCIGAMCAVIGLMIAWYGNVSAGGSIVLAASGVFVVTSAFEPMLGRRARR